MKRHPAKVDSYNACSNLTKLEEEVIVQYILDQDLQGFSPWIVDIGNVANLLLRKCSA